MGARSLFRVITVEPILFLNVLAYVFVFLAVENLVVQKTCSPQVRPSIGFICNDSAKVSQAADLTLTRNAVKSVLSAIAVPLLGSWRDVTGNNKLLLFGALGANTAIACTYLASAWSWSMSPWVPVIVEGICGGLLSGGFDVAVTCVVAETSTLEERTMRFQLLMVPTILASTFGSFINGYLLTILDYIWYFIVVICFYLIGLALAMILVRNKPDLGNKNNYEILNKLRFVFQRRPNSSIIWIMLLCGALIADLALAEATVSIYLFQQKFGFSMTEMGLYAGYRLMFSVVGIVLMSPLFTNVFKWSDFKIGIVSALLSLVSSLCMVLAESTTELYIFGALDLLKFCLYSPPKSIISKCVESDQLGTIVSFGSIITIALPFAINTLYKEVFSATSKTMPSAFYLVSAASYAILVLCFSVTSCLYRKPKDQGSSENHDNTKGEQKNQNVTIPQDVLS